MYCLVESCAHPQPFARLPLLRDSVKQLHTHLDPTQLSAWSWSHQLLLHRYVRHASQHGAIVGVHHTTLYRRNADEVLWAFAWLACQLRNFMKTVRDKHCNKSEYMEQ